MIGSVSRRRGWWSTAESLFVAGAEAVPVLLKCRRGHWWVTEARVTLHVGCEALGDVAACSFNSILIALLSGWTERGRWRWGSVYDRLRMRTGGESKWESQSNEACNLSGGHFSKTSTVGLDVPPLLRRDGWRFEPEVAESVAPRLAGRKFLIADEGSFASSHFGFYNKSVSQRPLKMQPAENFRSLSFSTRRN